jgi:beta-galactosidase
VSLKRTLGTCYYPEHWPEEIWAEDAARMASAWPDMGADRRIRLVAAGAGTGTLDWDWMDRAFDVLTGAGLKVVLGTPTATPPRWMLDRPRHAGRRRRRADRAASAPAGTTASRMRATSRMAIRITKAWPTATGAPRPRRWQTDNEYGCHDTVLSYSDAARDAFRDWLAQRYQSAEALNRAWGNVFWSMEYDDFDQIDLPNLTVTEPNPAHALDFRRFSSDQVARFNAGQVASDPRPVGCADFAQLHGPRDGVRPFRPRRADGNRHLGQLPLGFLEDRLEDPAEHKRRYARQGDPDFQAFHHDLYRAVGRGRWWVMEQQPGPVNWAPHNPAPLPGMVRFWTWEAFAHGAECVSYFRWRQAPFAQEQMHAGLLRPDSAEAPAFAEARQVAGELAHAPAVEDTAAPVALVFDYAPPGHGRSSRRALGATTSAWFSRSIAGCANLAFRSISCRLTRPISAPTGWS